MQYNQVHTHYANTKYFVSALTVFDLVKFSKQKIDDM